MPASGIFMEFHRLDTTHARLRINMAFTPECHDLEHGLRKLRALIVEQTACLGVYWTVDNCEYSRTSIKRPPSGIGFVAA